MSDEPLELRYADMPWGRELDEVVGRDCIAHLEDLGDVVYVGVYHGDEYIQAYASVGLKPLGMWWGTLKAAWYSRTWPSFFRVELGVMDASDAVVGRDPNTNP